MLKNKQNLYVGIFNYFSYTIQTGLNWYMETGVCDLEVAFFKVHLTPKYFFRLNNSLHLFETHCAFLHLFSPNLDFLQAVKVMKSGHHLFNDRASKGHGSIPELMSQTYLHACLQRLNTMQISL